VVALAGFQPSLLGALDPPRYDPDFSTASRRALTDGAWVDHAPGWLAGADALFDELLATAPFAPHERWMYDRVVAEPRLTTRDWEEPPPLLRAMADSLAARYGVDLPSISASLYRDGHDSVAWHGDRVGRRVEQTVVGILSLGSPRRFLLRPRSGSNRRSLRYMPASGDLLVLGGTCQRTWEHTVPKCVEAGPRISVMFREAY
jgi:alkylated DNA repair dioxygenase AlkB